MKLADNTMKNNYRRLNAIDKLLGMKNFYVISLSEFDLKLQGNQGSTLIAKLQKNHFKLIEVSTDGYIEFQRGCINVTLT